MVQPPSMINSLPVTKALSSDARYTAMMDINAGAMLTHGQTLEEKGREIYQMLIDVASGKQSKSEAQGLGDYEFVPWQIGVTM